MAGLDTVPASVQRLGTAVLLQGAAVPALARLAARGLRDRDRDGMPAPSALLAIVAALDEAADMSAALSTGHSGHAEMSPARTSSRRDALRTDEAARLLGLSPRQVRRLAPDLDAWHERGHLRYDRAAVETYANQRDLREAEHG